MPCAEASAATSVSRPSKTAAMIASLRTAGMGPRSLVAEIVVGDHAAGERELDEPRALAVLREVFDAEALEERADVRLDALHAEEHLFGDLPVGGGRGVSGVAAIRAAQREQDASLSRADGRPRRRLDVAGLAQLGPLRAAERDLRGAEV